MVADCLDLVGARGEDGMGSLSRSFLEISLLGTDGISATDWEELVAEGDVVCINRAEEWADFVTPRFVIVMVEFHDLGGLGVAVCHCEVWFGVAALSLDMRCRGFAEIEFSALSVQ